MHTAVTNDCASAHKPRKRVAAQRWCHMSAFTFRRERIHC